MDEIGTIKNIIGSIIKHKMMVIKNAWIKSLIGMNPNTAIHDSGNHVFDSIFANIDTG